MKGRAYVRGELVSEARCWPKSCATARPKKNHDSRFGPVSLAHVDASAHIGANAAVEPFAFVGPNVHIGAGTRAGPNATIMGNTKVGQDCKLFPGCVVGADSQDLKYKGEPTTVEIGDRTSIRVLTIHRATTDRIVTRVDSCLIMAYVHVAHDVQIGNHVILANSVNVAACIPRPRHY